MKKIKFYATVGMLSANILLTSCASQIKEQERQQRIEEFTGNVALLGENIAEETIKMVEEQNAREREEKEAFEKVLENPDFIETEFFKSVNQVSITYNQLHDYYEIEGSNDSNEDEKFTGILPAEARLISYMLKHCNVEYLSLTSPKDTTILEELTSPSKLKEISIIDSEISDFDILRKYQNLEGIRFDNCCNLRDISFFDDLANIEVVSITGTNVTDITPLSNCPNLTGAKLRCNKITNPEVLNNLENLTSLSLEYNKIEDISQLEKLVSNGVISEELAKNVVDTTTNHMLIFSNEGAELTGEYLVINYYDAIKEYYAEVKDESGNVVAYMCSEEPYSFYDISDKMGEKKFIGINNFPEDGYIHHLSDMGEYETVVVNNCDFDYFPIYNFANAESVGIYNCPNLTDTFEAHPILYHNKELKYLWVKNTGITTVDGLSYLHNLQAVDLRDNNVENFDVLNEINNLKSATITLDNPDYDYTSLKELIAKGVDLTIYEGVEKENNIEETVEEELETPHIYTRAY